MCVERLHNYIVALKDTRTERTSVLNIQLPLQATLSSSPHVTVASSSDQAIGKDAILTNSITSSQQDVSFRQHRDNCQHNKQRK